jgi:prepilin-type N-terminal cleavage/methylation domain-containing protein
VIARRRGPSGGPLRRGVSLIEVLLATAIFLISLASISVLVRTAADSATEATRTNLCSQLARSKMAELEAGVGDVTIADGGGGTFAEYPNYQWEVVSKQVTAGSGYGYAYDVTVRVWIETRLKTTEVSLSQILVDPALLNNAAPLTAPTTETPP